MFLVPVLPPAFTRAELLPAAVLHKLLSAFRAFQDSLGFLRHELHLHSDRIPGVANVTGVGGNKLSKSRSVANALSPFATVKA